MRQYPFSLSTILILILSAFSITGQNIAGAKQISLANANIASENNVFDIFNNPAGLSFKNDREFGFFYSPSPFGLKELSNSYLAYLEPTSFGNLSIGVYTYGFELYRENQFSLGYSSKFFDNIYLGITSYYHSVNINRYGNAGVFNVTLGGIFLLNQNISLGFSLHNPLRFSSSKIELPLIYTAGLSYIPVENSSINFAMVKEINFPVSIRLGMEYEFIEYIHLRVGIQNEPDIYSGGLGIFYSIVNLNYSITSHPELGLSHQFDLVINF